MIRKLVATSALLLGAPTFVAPAAAVSAGGGPSDYADCVITVVPSTFEAGATVTVTGTGFQPNFLTTIEFNSVTVVVGTVTTDATGSFETTVTIPADATPGPHTISAICDAEGNVSTTDVTISGGEATTSTTLGGPLPRTGTDIEPLVVAGVAALLAGITFVLIAKRRGRSARPPEVRTGVRYARHPQVLWRSTSSGPVVLAPAKQHPERLGGVAAVVWEVLERPMTAAEVAEHSAEVHGPASETSSALSELQDLGLLTSG